MALSKRRVEHFYNFSTMKTIIDQLRNELQANATEEIKLSSQRFFKEEIRNYGVKTPTVQKLSKQLFKEHKLTDKDEVFALCETLWQSGYSEEAVVACNWSYYVAEQYVSGDFEAFERWISNYVTNWASCDTLCNHTVGAFIEMYPEFIEQLKRFAKSENRWVKRAAAVTLIIPARRGKFLNDIFEIADILLEDEDDLVRKGYGWMLKAASEAHQQEVFEYVMKHKAVMPRTSLRYAIEKMPKELKAEAMKKK